MNGQTRDFCDASAILNEKTRHSHKRDSANPVQMHAKVTSSSENQLKMHTKNPPRPQIQGAVKAEGLQHKENPGPEPLPGKMHGFTQTSLQTLCSTARKHAWIPRRHADKP